MPPKAFSKDDLRWILGSISVAISLTGIVIWIALKAEQVEDNKNSTEKLEDVTAEIKSTFRARAEIDKFHEEQIKNNSRAILQNQQDIRSIVK